MVLCGWQPISQTTALWLLGSELLSEHFAADTATLHEDLRWTDVPRVADTTTLLEVLPPILEAAETATADDSGGGP